MSRRASLIQKQLPEGKKSVRFPPDLVFLESLKDNDLDQAAGMLRRASLKLDINAIADSGLTPLHQAVINENMSAVRLLVGHGADVNARDEDSWTPLHAAAAVGSVEIIKILVTNGADPAATTVFDERPVDLCDSDDIASIGLLLDAMKKNKPDRTKNSSKVGIDPINNVNKNLVGKTNSLSPATSRRFEQSKSENHTLSFNNGMRQLSNLFSSSKSNNSSPNSGLKIAATKTLSKSEQSLQANNGNNNNNHHHQPQARAVKQK